MVEQVEDSQFGLMKQPGVTVKLRSTPGAVQGRAPLLGEHTEEVLEGFGYGADEIERLRDDGVV